MHCRKLRQRNEEPFLLWKLAGKMCSRCVHTRQPSYSRHPVSSTTRQRSASHQYSLHGYCTALLSRSDEDISSTGLLACPQKSSRQRSTSYSSPGRRGEERGSECLYDMHMQERIARDMLVVTWIGKQCNNDRIAQDLVGWEPSTFISVSRTAAGCLGYACTARPRGSRSGPYR